MSSDSCELEGEDNDADTDEHRAMSTAATVTFDGVKVVAESALALCCRIMGRDHWIPAHHLREGSSVAHFGDRGILIVSRRFAEDRGLLLHPFRPL